MNVALLLSLLIAAPSPGTPAPRREPPKDLEEVRWEPFFVDQCKARLEEAGWTKDFRFSRLNRLEKRKRRGQDPIYCHVPQAMVVQRGPTGISYYGFTLFNCAMGLAMSRFEEVAQSVAKDVFESTHERPIKGISHMGSYNCRRLRTKPGAQSQHSFGAALDISSFWVRGIGIVDVKRHWTARYPAQKKRAEFLHTLVERLREEQVFTNILDPEYDESHDNHLHCDLAALSDGEASSALARVKTDSAALKPEILPPPQP